MIKNEKLKKVLSELDGRINHVEDVTEDSKELLIQVVRQNNAIIKFLSSLEIEEISHPMEEELLSSVFPNEINNSSKVRDVYELINIFSSENEDLKKLEKELEKHKSEINKNVIGEA